MHSLAITIGLLGLLCVVGSAFAANTNATASAIVGPGGNSTVHKRQTTIYATFWQDNNWLGTQMSMDDTNMNIPDLTTYGFLNKISSFQMFDYHEVIQVFTGKNYIGNGWAFRTNVAVGTMSPFNMNDLIESIKTIAVAPGAPGVTLYVDNSCQGLSAYLGTGNWPNIALASSYGGVVPDNSVSSLLVLPGTTVTLYADQNYGGTTATYSVPAKGSSTAYTLSPGDWASSVKVAAY